MSTFLIDFESDLSGNKTNAFISNSSPLVKFSDSNSENLEISNFDPQSIGQGLGVNGDDTSKLLIEPTDTKQNFSSLSLVFGNDDSAIFGNVESPLYAVLEVYKDGIKIGQNTVEANKNDLADQTISITDVKFDQAVFYYAWDVGAGIEPAPLIEVVDNITGTQVPDTLGVNVQVSPDAINLGQNSNNNARLSVSIFSTLDFDATTINLNSLELTGAITGNSNAIATNPQGKLQIGFEDINRDGITDITVNYLRKSLSFNPNETEVNIVGTTNTGIAFAGSDTVSFV